MALKNFQIGCQEDKLAEYSQFLQEQTGSTQAEKLDEVFRLARKGAIEESSPLHKETVIFKKHVTEALKIFDGMAAQVAGLDKLILEAVTERTAKIQAELDGQKERIAEADAIIIQREETEQRIRETQKALADAEEQITLYKEKAERMTLDTARLAELEETAAAQAKQIEQARLDLAVMENDRKNKDDLLSQQEKRIAGLEQANQQEREQAKKDAKTQIEQIRQEWESKMAEMKQGHDALVESLKAQIEAQQKQILAMICEPPTDQPPSKPNDQPPAKQKTQK